MVMSLMLCINYLCVAYEKSAKFLFTNWKLFNNPRYSHFNKQEYNVG